MLVYSSTRSLAKKKLPSPKEQKLRAEWDRILKDAERSLSRKVSAGFKPKTVSSTLTLNFTKPRGPEADLRQYKSLGDQSGKTPFKSNPVYTGDKMLGVATLHKSNAVGVFSKEEILDVCTMRRG